jgi:6-methylsalicylate decarboxylase
MTSYGGSKYPGDPAFAPVFDELDRRGAVVYFHPTTATCSQCQPEIPRPRSISRSTRRARSRVCSIGGTFARCRNIKWIFSHAGGACRSWPSASRASPRGPRYKEKVPNGVIPELKRLYYDTALSANWLAFRSLLELVAPDQGAVRQRLPVRARGDAGRDREGPHRHESRRRRAARHRARHALKLFPQFG